MKHTILPILILCMLFMLVACGTTSMPAETQEAHIHSFGDWIVIKSATCTEQGQQERYCSCGDRQVQAIAALGHTFDAWAINKAATCTDSGKQERICTMCGEKQTQTIAATGHSFDTWVATKIATCTESGEQERTCIVCGERQIMTIAEKGHLYDEWRVTKEATCTKQGQKTRICTACKIKEEEIIPFTEHQWEAATCVKPKTCSICYATNGSALGHNYKNGVCTRCNNEVGATIILPSAGAEYGHYNYSNKLIAICQLTEIEDPKVYSNSNPQKLWYTVKVTMKSIYDSEGNNYSRDPVVGYKIYDEDNIVIKSGTLYGETVKVGETCYAELNIYYLEAGHTYSIEFLNVK